MSKIPDTPKTKYNHNDPFRWVDSQWEKFMTEQRELKLVISQLRKDLVTCNKHFQLQREEMLDLVEKVPSKYLTKSKPDWTPQQIAYWDKMIKDSINQMNKENKNDKWRIEQFNRNRAPEEHVKTIEEMEERIESMYDPDYIYESPDGGKTLYRRKSGHDNKEQIDSKGNPLPKQLNLFDE